MWLMQLLVPALLGLSSIWKGCSCTVDESILLFTDSFRKGLYGVSSKTGTHYTVDVKRVLNPIAIHYNEHDERVYWSDVSLKEIRSTSIDGLDDVTLQVLDNSSIPDGLAVDSISGLLFYTDAGSHLIALMDLRGQNHVLVVNKDCDQPRAIVLDPMKGHMYWTDWGKVPKIETANYDGSERKEIITTRLLWPNALAVDFKGQWMYWGDAGTHYIERSKLDGSHRKILYYETKAHYFSILLMSDKLYYTDWQYRSVMTLSISGEGNSTAVGNESSVARLNDITRFRAKPQYPRTNACSKNRGGCSHICLPRPKGKYVCMCPSGSYLTDGMHCSKSESRTCAPLNPNNFTTIFPKECTTQSSSTGMVCTVECKAGFFYGGCNKDLVCTEDGKWSGMVQDCIDVRRPVIHNCPESWQVIVTGKGKDTVTVKWSDVYATDNSDIAPEVYASMTSGVTLQEGKHTVNIFAVDHAGLFTVCEFTIIVTVRRCGEVPLPDRGYIISGWCPDYYGAFCKIACNTGYQFSSNTGIATIECNMDEDNSTLWTGADLQCEPISCPVIASPNVLVTGCNAPLYTGDVCEQTCAEGFERIYGTGIRFCKSDGTWSGQDLICRQKSVLCPQLSPLPHSYVDGCSVPFTVGSVCEQVCETGYKKEGRTSGIRVCKPDGTWSGHDVSCSESEKQLDNMPQTNAEKHTTNGWIDGNMLMTALVIVISLMLLNLGIFIHLRKLVTNARTDMTSPKREGNKFAHPSSS